jgi:hypothetical protein
MSTASRGAAREHAAKRLLESEGWAVTRGAGSHGCADLWAARPVEQSVYEDGTHDRGDYLTELRLIQVKTDKRSPYDHFGRKEREALIALADQTGGTPELWWWPANRPLTIFTEQEWPRVKVAA